jgi:hypothetical protein
VLADHEPRRHTLLAHNASSQSNVGPPEATDDFVVDVPWRSQPIRIRSNASDSRVNHLLMILHVIMVFFLNNV